MKRSATAEWTGGGLHDGRGVVTAPSGALHGAPYSFASRIGEEKATSPEELLAAAHAGCFAMALSKRLEDAGHAPKSIKAVATVKLGTVEGAFAITGVHLDVVADAPGIGAKAFRKAAKAAKKGCPVSKLFDAKITMDAALASAK